jgi:hypothetical protein
MDGSEVKLSDVLTPLFFWYDSSHITRTQPYIQLLEAECPKGSFPESTFGKKRMEE